MEVIFYQILGSIRMNEETSVLSTILVEEYLREREILRKMQEENEVYLYRYEVQVKLVSDLEGRVLENENSKSERKVKVSGFTAQVASGMIMGFAAMHWEKIESMLYTDGKAVFRDIIRFRK